MTEIEDIAVLFFRFWSYLSGNVKSYKMDTSKPSHKKTGLWVFLWVISGVIFVPMFKPFFILYNVITMWIRMYITKTLERGELTLYFKRCSISEDQLANVYGRDALNHTLLKKGTPRLYGYNDETISSANGKAEVLETSSWFGWYGVNRGLHLLEKNHSLISIEMNEGFQIPAEKIKLALDEKVEFKDRPAHLQQL